MKILRTINILLLSVFILMVAYGLVRADTHTAGGTGCTGNTCCTVANVQAAIDAAARGDTVSVPAGECTWTAPISITKGITLQGAGSTNTIITINYHTATTKYAEPCHWPLTGSGLSYSTINFKSSDIASDENELFRITGFRFNASTDIDYAVFISVINDQITPLRKVRIDNNFFYGPPTKTSWQYVLYTYGRIYGVFDSNTVDAGSPAWDIRGMSICDGADPDDKIWWGKYEWQNLTYTPGTSDTFFIEDNVVHQRVHRAFPYNNMGLGGRLTVRYNTFNHYHADIGYLNGFQSHGMYIYQYPPQGLEVYGNYTYASNQTTATFGPILYLCRASQCLGWNNYFNSNTGTVSAKGEYQHECNGALMAASTGTGISCPSATLYSGVNVCNSDGMPFHVHRSYQFQNRQGTAGTSLVTLMQLGSGTGASDPAQVCGSAANEATVAVRENQDVWKDNTSCTGSQCLSGVGCGSTLPTCADSTKCPTGVGFWLTSQSCSELTTSNVGAGGTLATKKRTGTLYVRKNDQWVAYYTPAPYPHELRTSDLPSDTDAPVMTNFSPTSPITCTDESSPYTMDVSLSLTATDQTSPVTCYYDTEERANYAALAASGHEMTASGTTFSATAAGLACAASHTIWYACSDGTTASSVGTYQFTIAGREDEASAVITNTTTANQACASLQRISATTDKPSTMKFCKAGETVGEGVCDVDTSYADMPHTFSVTGGETGHVAHSTDVSQACSSTVNWYVRASTTQGVANTSSTAVTITTDAAKTVTISGSGMTITIGSGANQITIIPQEI